MAVIRVRPERFELVFFEAAEIERIAGELAEAVGLPPDLEVHINVDESLMVGRFTSRLEDRTIVIDVSGAAFEDLRKGRHFSEERTRAVLAHALMRARDRLDAAFGEPPPDPELSIQQESAWASSIEGRLSRLGLPARRQRRLYHFRVRHGFHDGVDAAFQALWDLEAPTWAAIEALSQEARESAPAPS